MPMKRKKQQQVLTSFFRKKTANAESQEQKADQQQALGDASNHQQQQLPEQQPPSQPPPDTTPAVVESVPPERPAATEQQLQSLNREGKEEEETSTSSATTTTPTTIPIADFPWRPEESKPLFRDTTYSSLWRHPRRIHQPMHGKNIVHSLLRRQVHHRRLAPTSTHVYTPCTSLVLAGLSTQQQPVHQLAWDRSHVLLAVAVGRGLLHVYDWYAVQAASIRRRSTSVVPPLLSWRADQYTPVAVMAWNPWHEDELVVGMQARECLYVFDLRIVQGWLEDTHHGRPPCRELLLGRDSEGLVESATVCFPDDSHILLATATTVVAWHVGPWEQPDQVPPLWKWQYKHSITSLRPRPGNDNSTLVVGGTAQGHVFMLDWKKIQTNAWGVDPRPTVVWIRPATHHTPGVCRFMAGNPLAWLAVDGSVYKLLNKKHQQQLSMLVGERGTRPVRVLASDENLWCCREQPPPQEPLSSDARVLHSQTALPPPPLALSLWTMTDNAATPQAITAQLPEDMSVKTITMDPTREWILLGTSSHGLCLLRNQKKQRE